MTRGEEPQSWLVVALAILMDTHEAMGDHGRAAFDRARASAAHIKVVADECLVLYKPIMTGHFGRVANEHVKPQRNLAALLANTIDKERTPANTWKEDLTRLRDRCIFPGSTLLPHVAGKRGYLLKLDFHRVGTHAARDEQGILPIAHLYKAARRYVLCPAWPDMDFVIAQHSSTKPFVTKTHSNADPYALIRHYMIDLGYDTVYLSKARVPPLPACGVLWHKKAKDLSVITSPLRAAWQEAQSQNIHMNRGQSRHDVLTTVLTALTSTSTSTSGSKGRPATQTHYSPAQLLSTLKSHLIEDEPRLNFDYFGFSHLCIATFAEPFWSVTFPDTPWGAGHCAHKMVYYLLKTAAQAEEAGKPIASTSFGLVAEVMKALIVTDGKKFSQAAFDQSSGRIPKSQRPVPADQRKDISAAKEAVLKAMPGTSIGPSNSGIELYDPHGSADKARGIMAGLMQGKECGVIDYDAGAFSKQQYSKMDTPLTQWQSYLARRARSQEEVKQEIETLMRPHNR